ncbi:DEAD/DEAH box helicase [Spiroplasma endosymbiont of Aspidapion aeneum]|uniref:DEAD/DEAH box helicase n=1 Tax=Spiroplasma endosymbiont of Aspidapion aeneum TaxID=3066276 RepID=UPI00313C7B95
MLQNLKSDMTEYIRSCKSIKIVCPFISREAINFLILNLNNNNSDSIDIDIITTDYDQKATNLSFDGLEDLLFWANSSNKQLRKVSIYLEQIQNGELNKRLHSKIYWFIGNSKDNSVIFVGSNNFTESGINTGNERYAKFIESQDQKFYKENEKYINSLIITTKFKLITRNNKWLPKYVNDIDLYKENYKTSKEECDTPIKNNKENFHNNIDEINEDLQVRPYQQEAIDKITKNFDDGKKDCLLVMATGTGKTFVASQVFLNILKKTNKQISFLFVTHRNVILEQALKYFKMIFDLNKQNFDPVIINGHVNQEDIKNKKNDSVFICKSSLQLDKWSNILNREYDFVIFDEAHHIKADIYKKIYYKVIEKSKKILCMTATPFGIENIFGEPVYTYTLNDAISQNYLSNFKYQFVSSDSVVDDSSLVVDENSALKFIDNHKRFLELKSIISTIKVEDLSMVRAIVFCSSVEECNKFVKLFESDTKNKINIKCSTISSYNKKNVNDKLITDFRNGKINILFTVDILNEGVDIPEIDYIFLLRPTESITIYLQQIGRGLRKYKNKVLKIFDFVYNFNHKFDSVLSPYNRIACLAFDSERYKEFIDQPFSLSTFMKILNKSNLIKNIDTTLLENSTFVDKIEAMYRKSYDIKNSIINFLIKNQKLETYDLLLNKLLCTFNMDVKEFFLICKLRKISSTLSIPEYICLENKMKLDKLLNSLYNIAVINNRHILQKLRELFNYFIFNDNIDNLFNNNKKNIIYLFSSLFIENTQKIEDIRDFVRDFVRENSSLIIHLLQIIEYKLSYEKLVSGKYDKELVHNINFNIYWDNIKNIKWLNDLKDTTMTWNCFFAYLGLRYKGDWGWNKNLFQQSLCKNTEISNFVVIKTHSILDKYMPNKNIFQWVTPRSFNKDTFTDQETFKILPRVIIDSYDKYTDRLKTINDYNIETFNIHRFIGISAQDFNSIEILNTKTIPIENKNSKFENLLELKLVH